MEEASLSTEKLATANLKTAAVNRYTFSPIGRHYVYQNSLAKLQQCNIHKGDLDDVKSIINLLFTTLFSYARYARRIKVSDMKDLS